MRATIAPSTSITLAYSLDFGAEEILQVPHIAHVITQKIKAQEPISRELTTRANLSVNDSYRDHYR